MSSMNERTKKISEAICGALDYGTPALGIDLDGTIDEAPGFFAAVSRGWQGKVYVITYRDDAEKARRDAESHGVRVDEVVLVKSFAEKSERIRDLGIAYFFDDMDEVLQHIDGACKVFKVRNEGNFDYDSKRWLYSRHTGEII